MNMKKAVLLILALVLVFASTAVAGAEKITVGVGYQKGDTCPHTDGVVETPASCTKDGVVKGICRHFWGEPDENGQRQFEERHFPENIEDLDHAWDWVPQSTENLPCETPIKYIKTCTKCQLTNGEEMVSDEKVDHAWFDDTDPKNRLHDIEGCNVGTCGKKEHYYVLCQTCSAKSEIREGDYDYSFEHIYGAWTPEKGKEAKGCELSGEPAGTLIRVCSECQIAREEKAYYLDHVADKTRPVYETEPTCTAAGYVQYPCIYDDPEKDTDDHFAPFYDPDEEAIVSKAKVKPLGHLPKLNEEKTDKPTCSFYGFQVYECAREGCGVNVTDEVVKTQVDRAVLDDNTTRPALPAWTMERGEKREILDKLPHTWNGWEERIGYVPDGDGATYGYWINYCKECGYEDFKIDKDNTDNWVPDPKSLVKPTCTTDGKQDLVLYSGNGDVLERKTEVLPKLGHDPVVNEKESIAATCETDGKIVTKCSRCKEDRVDVVLATGHKMETVAATKPTGSKAGNKEYQICANCKKTFDMEGKEINPADMVIPPVGGLSNDDGAFKYYDENGKVMDSFTGLVDFEGGKFFVRNGVLDTTVNGPQSPDAKNFYFFANGQICSNYSGMALYDGKWFVVENGVFKTGFNGLYSWNGGKFWVAAGQKTDADGLVQTAEGWLYFEDGCVIPHNGLVNYDGEVFYVKDGKLQESFTGIVKDHNGVQFNVVNGMVK